MIVRTFKDYVISYDCVIMWIVAIFIGLDAFVRFNI